MRLIPIMKGDKFRVLAIDTSDDPSIKACPVEEFITQMEKSSKNSLSNILRRHADRGPIINKEKSRLLWDDIYEFKTRQNDRMYYFFDSGGLTILTHGSIKPKKKQLSTEVQRAVTMRNLYLDMKGE